LNQKLLTSLSLETVKSNVATVRCGAVAQPVAVRRAKAPPFAEPDPLFNQNRGAIATHSQSCLHLLKDEELLDSSTASSRVMVTQDIRFRVAG